MIGIMIDQKLAKYERSIRKTCSFIFETLGIPYKFVEALDYPRETEIVLLYTLIHPPKEALIELAAYGVVLFVQVEQELILPERVTKQFVENNTQEIELFNPFPVISSRSFDNPIEFHRIGESFWGELKFDIIANILYHLSDADDVPGGQKDQYGRYEDANLSYFSYTRVPYVNYLLWIVENLIKDIITENEDLLIVKKEYWPGGEDFACAITTDVDRLTKWTFGRAFVSMFSDMLLLPSLKLPLFMRNWKERIGYFFTNAETYWRFEEMGDVFAKHSVKTTWFIAANEPNDRHLFLDYSFDETDLQEEIRIISENKHEIALLVDADMTGSKEMENRKKKLSNIITGRIKGIRNVAGQTDAENLFKNLNKPDIIYDASVRLIDQVGFRNGIAFPYKPYRHNIEEEIKFWEVPIVFSDTFLQISKTKFVSKEKAKEIVKTLIKAVQETNGLMTLNFSMSRFNDITYLQNLIEYTISLLKDRNSYLTSLGEIIEWWEKRKQVIISREDNNFILVSFENIEKLTLTIWGVRKPTKVTGAEFHRKGDKIILEKIKKNREIIIHTTLNEQAEILADYNQE